MARYVGSLEIARPPRVVFELFDTPENTPRYTEGVVSCTQISGVRQGVGARDATTRVEPTEGGGSRVTFDFVYRPTLAAAKRVIESEPAGAYRAAG